MKALGFLAQIHGEKCWPSVDKISPCEEACPLHTDVPSYVIAIAQGKFKEALAVIRQTNPFPSVCGRVCHHPCEEECNRVLIDKPVAIQWLKRLVADYELNGGARRPRRARRTRKERVAIVGSGPAGLTAAYDLVRQGYGVTVYEASPVAGGMLATGIPDFILPKEIVEAEIGYIKDLGVEIKTNTPIGEDLTLDDLWRRGYNAIFLAAGAHASQKLGIPGEDLEGVIDALLFLKAVKLGQKVHVRGKVAVIGGGNVAIDSARTALRLDCEEVSILYRRSREEMPATDDEVEAAEREGVKIQYLVAPIEVLSTKGRVGGLRCTRMELGEPDSSGRRRPIPIKGSQFLIELDTVISAIGQASHLSLLSQVSGIETKKDGTFVVDSDTMATNLAGVFAGGDCVTLPGTVTESMAAGRKAAQSIDRYLQGKDLREGQPLAAKEVLKIEPEMIPGFLICKARWEMPLLSPQDAVRCFREVKLGYTEWQGIEEAKRCLNCRMCANCIFERGQICFETGTRLL